MITTLNVPQAPPSPRLVSNSQDKVKLIQIPQDDYQQFIDHLPICKKSQEEIGRLKSKAEELGRK